MIKTAKNNEAKLGAAENIEVNTSLHALNFWVSGICYALVMPQDYWKSKLYQMNLKKEKSQLAEKLATFSLKLFYRLKSINHEERTSKLMAL